jgi:hypothetical protein
MLFGRLSVHFNCVPLSRLPVQFGWTQLRWVRAILPSLTASNKGLQTASWPCTKSEMYSNAVLEGLCYVNDATEIVIILDAENCQSSNSEWL